MVVFDFTSEQLSLHMGNSFQARYLRKYLEKPYLMAKTCVLEEDYIDKDYLIDYSKFYARSFNAPKRATKRIHFFSGTFNDEDLTSALTCNEGAKNFEVQKGNYLGFCTIKDVKDFGDEYLIGRTILSHYPEPDGDSTRVFIHKGNDDTDTYKISLYGIKLTINTLPFQVQDEGVSKCATIALWIAMQPLQTTFGIPAYSPAEITEICSTTPSEERNFPSQGLNLGQMITYIKCLGLEPETLKATPEIVEAAVKAYIPENLPILVDLTLVKNGENDYHAAVISGYRHNKKKEIEEIYLHDDGIGPYSKAKYEIITVNKKWKILNGMDVVSLKNEWVTERGYDALIITRLIVPVYPKMRLTFSRIYKEFLRSKNSIEARGLTAILQPKKVNDYKKYLLSNNIENKETILKTPMPRFLWIMRALDEDNPIFDEVYDATSVYAKKVVGLETINYKRK